MILNNRFNTTKPFTVALVEELGSYISDHMFAQACIEFEINEDEGMGKMMNSTEYEFIRLTEGWTINKTR